MVENDPTLIVNSCLLSRFVRRLSQGFLRKKRSLSKQWAVAIKTLLIAGVNFVFIIVISPKSLLFD